MFRTYQCLYCSELFIKEQDLMGHIKRVHEASTRETELFHRAQASDYSRKIAPVRIADVIVMFFAGIVTTLILAYVVGQ